MFLYAEKLLRFTKRREEKLTKYGQVSKWGRLRVRPVDDTASNKEWQRSKFFTVVIKKFRAPQQDITGSPLYITTEYQLILFLEFSIYGQVSKWS